MKFTTLLAGALSLAGSIVSAAPVEGAALEARQGNALKASYTDDYMFVRDLGNFIRNRNNKNPDYLIWTSDGCSYSPDEPNGWGFFKACWRHDFGYRNFKDQGRFDSYNKERIDLQFLKEYVFLSFLSILFSSPGRLQVLILMVLLITVSVPSATCTAPARPATPWPPSTGTPSPSWPASALLRRPRSCLPSTGKCWLSWRDKSNRLD